MKAKADGSGEQRHASGVRRRYRRSGDIDFAAMRFGEPVEAFFAGRAHPAQQLQQVA